MKTNGRYDVAGLVEAQYEAGSEGKVLRNLLKITDPDDMDSVEADALAEATNTLIRCIDQDHQFLAADICHFHKIWLGKAYEWAGRYRQVNISKGNFPFAMAAQVAKLMEQFEHEQLKRYTHCIFEKTEEVVQAIAEVHVELVLIHPFREGNGRIARLLSTLMALQAGFPLLDFSGISEQRNKYFLAVQAGMELNYKPMEQLFSEIIRNSVSASAG
ncbi:MAG: Fic family protein [Desulfobacterales bacterium]|nr:Fic family protein [Desulfobacterales bacterium]